MFLGLISMSYFMWQIAGILLHRKEDEEWCKRHGINPDMMYAAGSMPQFMWVKIAGDQNKAYVAKCNAEREKNKE